MAVTNDLVTDRRVDKTCMALREAGCNVTLIGRKLPNSKPIERLYVTRRIKLIFNKKVLFYAEYNIRLFFIMLFTKADLFYANDVDTLPACALAAKLRRKKLFLDAHELFSEVPELVERKVVKHLWQRIEKCFISSTDRAITVCQSVADEYEKRTGKKMAVVRNFAPKSDEAIVRPKNTTKTILYQGAVNVGRGIEWAIEAMQYLDNCRLVIAGEGDIYHQLKHRVNSLPWANRIEFLGRVEPAKLMPLTKSANLGLVLLDNMGLNYYYSLPNRIGDFVQAGVPVLATDFPEIKKIIEIYSTGTLINNEAKQPQLLAQKISHAIEHWEQMPDEEYNQIFDKARHDLCWENEKKVFLDTISTIFSEN
ncbi:MAG: glycosyltransferase [Bacteroidales bacterium]|nr:glycosyltransferase [Bacteroidales bacterium]